MAELAHPVLCHRLILDGEAQFRGVDVEQVIDQLLAPGSRPLPCAPERRAREPAPRRPGPDPRRPVRAPGGAWCATWPTPSAGGRSSRCSGSPACSAAAGAGLVALVPVRPDVALAVTPRRTVAGDSGRGPRPRDPCPPPVPACPARSSRSRSGQRTHLVRLPTLRRNRVVEERITLTGLRRGVDPGRAGVGVADRPVGAGALAGARGPPAAELLVLPRMVAVGRSTGGAGQRPGGHADGRDLDERPGLPRAARVRAR